MTHDFIDYYEALEISPNAQPETIHRVYRLLAQTYHPDNKDTGSPEHFSRVLEAYRVLSDPERRAAYDVEHRTAAAMRFKIWQQASGPVGISGEKRKRAGILALLYARRACEPDRPGMNIAELEQLLGCAREHLELSLWYLRESGRIQRTDNVKYVLTAKGLETLEDAPDFGNPRYTLPAPEAEQRVAS